MNEFTLGDWDDVRVFLAVARWGSFSRAADALGSTQSTVSRRIQGLEVRLGARLFERHAHGMRPTAAARVVRRRAELMETQALSIERALIGTDSTAQGKVRLTGTEGVLSCWLVPRLASFQLEFPDIQLALLINDRKLSLSDREADIALRFGAPKDPRLIARSLGVVRFCLFASRQYAEIHGLPHNSTEARDHTLINHECYYGINNNVEWQDLINSHAEIALDTNSSISYLQAIRHGVGLGLLPLEMGESHPDLIPVEIDVGYCRELFLVTHEDTDQSARIQALVQYIRSLARDGLGPWIV